MFGRRKGVIARCDPAGPGDGIAGQAAAVLAAGGVIAFPTDTVYGLGCRADSAAAIRRIYKIKRRSRGKPLVLMVPPAAPLSQWAAAIPDFAGVLAERFWPGPLTLVLPAARQICDWKLDQNGTVGIRQAASPVVSAILDRIKVPLATTSANPSGCRESLSADEVARNLSPPVDLILDGGILPARPPSTVVSLCGRAPVILRKGGVTRAALELALGARVRLGSVDVMFVCTGNTCRSPMAEGYLRHILPKDWRGRVTVHSSGTGALAGMPAAPAAVLAARKAGFAIGGHRAALLTDRLIRQSDLIVAMEEHHRQAIRALAPEARPVLLSPDGVPDPIGGEIGQYHEALGIIKNEMPDVLVLIGELLA